MSLPEFNKKILNDFLAFHAICSKLRRINNQAGIIKVKKYFEGSPVSIAEMKNQIFFWKALDGLHVPNINKLRTRQIAKLNKFCTTKCHLDAKKIRCFRKCELFCINFSMPKNCVTRVLPYFCLFHCIVYVCIPEQTTYRLLLWRANFILRLTHNLTY